MPEQVEFETEEQLIERYRAYELRALNACHDEEAHVWAARVDELVTHARVNVRW